MFRDLFSAHFHSDIWSNKWNGWLGWESRGRCLEESDVANGLRHIEPVPPVGEAGCGKQIAGLRVIPVAVSVIAPVTVRESTEIPA